MQLPTIRKAERLPLFLKVNQVCAILGVSKQFVHQLIQRDDFPAIRIERIIRVPRDDFFAWVAQRQAAKAAVVAEVLGEDVPTGEVVAAGEHQ